MPDNIKAKPARKRNSRSVKNISENQMGMVNAVGLGLDLNDHRPCNFCKKQYNTPEDDKPTDQWIACILDAKYGCTTVVQSMPAFLVTRTSYASNVSLS